MIVAMVIAGSTSDDGWEEWYVYSPLMFAFVILIFCVIYAVMLSSAPSQTTRRAPRGQTRTVAVITTTETINPAFQLEPTVQATLPGYELSDAPPKYTDVVKGAENSLSPQASGWLTGDGVIPMRGTTENTLPVYESSSQPTN